MQAEKRTPEAYASNLLYPDDYRQRCSLACDQALQKTEGYRSWCRYDNGSSDIFLRLAALPALTKRELRKYGPQGFVPAGRDLAQALASGEVELVKTSGTTSDQVTNVWYQPWWNECEANSWQLNRYAREAATGNHREAILTSPLCSGVPCEEALLPPAERRIGRFLFLSEKVDPRTWDNGLMNRMVREINAYKPVLLEANPSFLAILARYILRTGATVYRPHLITFTYENPSRIHYRLVRQAFGAPVASSYGSTEAGYVFMECEQGRLHQVCRNVHVDFLPFRAEHSGPRVGQLLVTTLANPWRSLLRFDIGDLALLADEPCLCGNEMGLTLASIEGRTINLTCTADGRAVTMGEVDRILSQVDGLVEYQVLQTAHARYQVLLVPEGVPPARVSEEARARLQELYGNQAHVTTKIVSAIAPDPPGKYRLVKTNFVPQVADLLEPRYAPPALEE